jgi:hypothetical protein
MLRGMRIKDKRFVFVQTRNHSKRSKLSSALCDFRNPFPRGRETERGRNPNRANSKTLVRYQVHTLRSAVHTAAQFTAQAYV